MTDADDELPEGNPGCGQLPQSDLERAAEARIDHGIRVDEMVLAHIVLCRRCNESVARMAGHSRLRREIVRAGALSLSSTAEERGASDGDVVGVAGHAPIPGYRLGDEIHRGGQGTVFAAEQLATRRRCAIKMLIGGRFATATQRIRFEREVEVVAALRHPAIVTLYESGVSSAGEPWYAMEFVDGEPLDDFVARTKPTPRAIAALFRRISDAVAYAHRRGVIHRDLKPGNILIDREGAPRILDFGLARAVGPAGGPYDPRSGSTKEGEFVGTFAYAAPEQLSDDASSVDARCDLYALGVVFYECIAGESPFSGCRSLADLVERKRRGAVRSLREAAAAKGVHLTRDLDVIAMRLLAPDPARRYDTAAALTEDLARALDGRPILAREDSRLYVIGKTLQRYWIFTTMATVLLSTVLVAGVALAVAYREADSARIRAEGERQRVERAYATFREALETADPEIGVASTNMFVADFVRIVEEQVQAELESEPELLAEVLQTLGLIQLGFDQPLRASDAIFRAYEIQARGHKQGTISDAQYGAAMHALARLRFAQRDFAGSEIAYRESLELRTRALGSDAVATVDTMRQLASAIREQGRLDEAAAILQEALERSARFPKSREAAVARAAILNGRAVLFAAIGDHPRAAEEFRTTLAELSPFIPPTDFRVGRTLYSLARAEQRLGNLDIALLHAQRALEILTLRKGDTARSVRAARELLESLEREAGDTSGGGA